jgi:Pretoxin HINT domain
VLLASGAAIPISQLKPGDKVLATNTKTGRTQAETVKAVIVEHDIDLYDLTVKVHGKTAVIQTTAHHRFWDQTTRRWTYADALPAGDLLRTPGHAQVSVVSGQAPADTVGWMWDLSVPGGHDHDFYIDVATTAVLVHNCDISNPQSFEGASRADAEQELVNNGWQDAGPTAKGDGVRWRLPGNDADQVRMMPGNPADPDVIKQGPYIRLSISGRIYGPFSLSDF